MTTFQWCSRLAGLWFFLAVCGPAHASDTRRAYLGDWGQTGSSAGVCSNCGVSIRGSSGRIRVTANNGWAADLAVTAAGLEGKGQWGRPFKGAGASSAFSIVFILVNDELHMLMRMKDAASRPRVIQAVYRKNWSGV